MGNSAYSWIDWIAAAGLSLWQMLPLVPVSEGGSPYNALSALGGNDLLISPEGLVRDGLLPENELDTSLPTDGPVDFPAVITWKKGLHGIAHERFTGGAAPHLSGPYRDYCARNSDWLEDYALFRAIRDYHEGSAWTEWDESVRDRSPRALQNWGARLFGQVDHYRFLQFIFDRQWRELRAYANEKGIQIIGDIPIFVAHDSADVWAHRELFQLTGDGHPEVVSGVPPDYFSETGQRWGNPLYRWDIMADRNYDWWIERFRRTFEWVDVVRIDHFRGFEAYWEIPADEPTAIHGEWKGGPGESLFEAAARELGPLPVIAEDLGLITPEVEVLRDRLGFPGMRVLQFAFDGDPENPHLPENYPPHSVAYTGTHDNETSIGWWESASPDERDQLDQLVGEEDASASWKMIRLVWDSNAGWVVAPLQDILSLGSEARMNVPGRTDGNWGWRVAEGSLTRELADRLRSVTLRYDRTASSLAGNKLESE